MAVIRVSARQLGLVTLLLTISFAACTPEEPRSPFKRVFRSSVENADNRGFMWVAKKPEQPDPDGRYEGGYDLEFNAGLGVCRLRHGGGVHPGKVFAGKCNTGFAHQEVSSGEYDLLLARHDAFWHLAPKPGMELDKALSGGHEADGKPLRLCVARHRTGWWVFSNHRGYHPGKYVHGKCNFGFGGQEVSGDDFFLVALGSRPTRSADRDAADGGTADAGTTGSTNEVGADAGIPEQENADSGTGATLPVAVRVASQKQGAPVRPVSCLKGEVACHCEKVSGCTLEGFCPCSP